MSTLLDKIFNIYLRIFLLGTLIFYVPNELAYAPQEKFFQLGAMGFFGLSLIVPSRRSINNQYLGILFLYAMLNTLILHYVDFSLGKMFNCFLGVVVIKTIAERVDLNFKKIGEFFTVICILNIIQLSLQVLNIDPIFTMINGSVKQIDHTGLLSSRFILASVGALMLPFMYSASPIYLLAVVPLLWFGKSSICVLASALAIIFLISKGDKRKMFMFGWAFIAIASAYIFLVDVPGGGIGMVKRFPVWGKGVEILRAHPWFGVGLGSWLRTGFVTIQQNGEPEQWTWAHNDFLQWMFESGIAGLVILWIWLKDMFKSCKDGVCICALSILSVIAFFHFPFHIARLAGLGCFIIACVEARRSECRQ